MEQGSGSPDEGSAKASHPGDTLRPVGATLADGKVGVTAPGPEVTCERGSLIESRLEVDTEMGAEKFYRALLYELGEHARKGGTAIGAAAVAKRVARQYGLEHVADRLPLPRLTRAELEDLGRRGASYRTNNPESRP